MRFCMKYFSKSVVSPLIYYGLSLLYVVVSIFVSSKLPFAKLWPEYSDRKFRSSHSQFFFEISVSKNFLILTGKHRCWSLLLVKLQACRCCLCFCLILRYSQLFSCEYCKIFKNSFLYGTPPVAASVNGWGISKKF